MTAHAVTAIHSRPPWLFVEARHGTKGRTSTGPGQAPNQQAGYTEPRAPVRPHIGLNPHSSNARNKSSKLTTNCLMTTVVCPVPLCRACGYQLTAFGRAHSTLYGKCQQKPVNASTNAIQNRFYDGGNCKAPRHRYTS